MSRAAEIIAKEVKKQGAVSFARFMELALYCPVYGYYEKEKDTIGRAGDYYTSVSVGRLFGELLAFQFAEWLEQQSEVCLVRPGPTAEAGAEAPQILEAGTHNAQLARDILTWLGERRPSLFDRVEYWIVEPSPRRQAWQERTLGGLANKVRWVKNLAEVGASPTGARADELSHVARRVEGIRGIIFANELLDAMPVHRLGWDAKRRAWFEWGVTLEAGRFAWTRLADNDAGRGYAGPLPSLAETLAALLPDGFTVEVCPSAIAWWQMAASVLQRGKLLTIDYGRSADELFAPERKDGTLRAYSGHRPSQDVLARPGEQDITADVDFTAIQAAGEAAGLVTEDSLDQAQLLTRIAARAWQNEGAFGTWTPERTRQFQTLTHPEHLGRSFRVLLQNRRKPEAQAGGDCSS